MHLSADGEPRRGTFHTNFKLDATNANWIGLYDSGKKLLDQVIVPAGTLKANQSYARVSDAADQWEVKVEAKINMSLRVPTTRLSTAMPKWKNSKSMTA